jgi:hypothetical protein
MKKGTKVEWKKKFGLNGRGVVISDEDNGQVLVAVDDITGEARHVIYCEVSKLTEHAEI